MKKLMAIVISMAMVLAMMPMGVFAGTNSNTYIKAPLADKGNTYTQEELENGYELNYDSDTNIATITVKGKVYKNGENKDGKWIGIGVKMPAGTTALKYQIGTDEVKTVSGAENLEPGEHACFYWDYAAKDVQTVRYAFGTPNDIADKDFETVNIIVNAIGDTDVAKIGNRYFATLQEAVNADGSNTIDLCKDVTLTDSGITVTAAKSITLDLNEYDIIGNGSFDTITVAKNANLTIEGDGTVDNKTHAKAAIFNNGTAILNGGTYDRTLENGKTKDESGNNSFYTIINHGTMTINAGVTVQTANGSNKLGRFSSLVENGYYSYNSENERLGYVNVTNSEKPTLTINGGSFLGGLNTIKNDDGAELTINNGTFSNFYQAVVQNHNIATINDGEFTAAADGAETYGVDNCGCAATYDKGTLTIKGGTFTASKYAVYDRSAIEAAVKIENGTFSGGVEAIGVTGNSKANIAVTGGTFSSNPKAYIADNHIVYAAPDKYTVEPFDADRAGIKIAPLEDRANNILKKDLEDGYSLDYEGQNITINVKPQLHANGADPAVTGKWIGIAVPVPVGATKINWTVNGTSIGEDDCAGNNIDWTDDDGVKYETLYWNYATKDITSIGYKFNNVGGTNTVKIAVNATPTTVIVAPLHDNAATNPIADNALYSKYDIAYVDDTATITVKGLKAHTNGVGSVGKWVGIAVPADYSNADTKLIYKYGDGEVKEADLTDEIWTKDGKKYVSFYMDINSKKSETISYTFGTSKDNAKGFNTVKVNIVEESEYTGGGAAVVPPATDNVTNNPADKNTTADLAPAVKDNKAETTVDAKTADKIVDKAVENKSTEVVIDAAGNNNVASSEVAIPEKTVKELAEKTDANLVIKTDNGKVDLDKTALEAVAEQAGNTGFVRLIIETIKSDENICHVNLKLITSNGAVTDFRGGNVKVTINLTKELAAKELVCVYIDDNGIYTLVNGQKNADGTYTFTTGHFSEYAVMAKEEADKTMAEQLNTLIKDVNLKVRTSKTSKKNIRAVVSGDVKALTDAGYTVKYKFYRSEKKASKYVGKVTKTSKTYINTAGKKGTKYYYKAKALVYDGDKLVGQTVLTQCKYGVRTWSK